MAVDRMKGSAQPWIGVSMRSDPDGRLLGCLQHLRAAAQRVAVSVLESDVEAVLRSVGTSGPAHRDRTWAGDAEGQPLDGEYNDPTARGTLDASASARRASIATTTTAAAAQRAHRANRREDGRCFSSAVRF